MTASTPDAVRILGISGSLRAGSWNTALLRAAAELSPPDVRLLAGLKRIPPFDEDDEGCPHAAVAALRRSIREADALLIATPEYNGSLPGQLKNALDWASRPPARSVLRGKPVAVIGASTGLFGAVWAQDQLRRTLALAGAVVLEGAPLQLGEAASRFDHEGRLVRAEDRAALEQGVAGLVYGDGAAAAA